MIVKMALQHGEQGMAYADVYPRGLYAYLLAMPHTTGTKATGPTVSGDTEYVVSSICEARLPVPLPTIFTALGHCQNHEYGCIGLCFEAKGELESQSP